MTICHVSDTHTFHNQLTTPEVDVLVHSGDIGSRTNSEELIQFLSWFENQPAKIKIFIGGNHDWCLDPRKANELKKVGEVFGWSLQMERYNTARELIKSYRVVYLNNKEFVYEGVKFWGSPYSPSFNRENWVFNADRGEEISKEWSKIPSDVNALITHTPPYGVLDMVPDRYKRYPDEDIHTGCKDLLGVIKKRCNKLKVHMFGHIHSQYGVVSENISRSRKILFSNGSVLDNDYHVEITKPLIITI